MADLVDTCPICGTVNHYIFRKSATHWKSGKVIYPRNRRALKIKLTGCSH